MGGWEGGLEKHNLQGGKSDTRGSPSPQPHMCILHSELCEHLQIVRFAVLKSAVNGTTLIDSHVLYPIVWGGVCGMVYMCLRPIKIGGVKFQQYITSFRSLVLLFLASWFALNFDSKRWSSSPTACVPQVINFNCLLGNTPLIWQIEDLTQNR